MEELKDIKPDVVIVNATFVDTILIVIGILVVLILVYFIYKFLKKDKKVDKRKASVLYLKSFDFEMDDKQLAYEFTKHGYITVEEHFNDEFSNIIRQLESYKYKKEISKMDDDLKEQIREYIKVRIR